jgi:uncharacterized protein (DUF885 family)
MRLGLPVAQFPNMTLAQAKEDAQKAVGFIRELQVVKGSELSHDEEMTRQFLLFWLQERVDYERDFLYTFPVTPYRGGWAFIYPQMVIAGQPISTQSDRELYLRLVEEYAQLVEQIGDKLEL